MLRRSRHDGGRSPAQRLRPSLLVPALVGALLLVLAARPVRLHAEAAGGSPKSDGTGATAVQQKPLHEVIDRQIAAGWEGVIETPAELASDAEFLRRVHLDLTGMVPTGEQLRAFLENGDPHKREQVIDRLLRTPDFARHMAEVFDRILMERRAGNNIPDAEWKEYLREAFLENRPYDELVREILAADGTDVATRPAAKFYLERGQTDLLVRDIGRIFLGVDLQCAQCHDHPVIGDYAQYDYYGLYAYLDRSFVFNDKKSKKAYFAEKAESEVKYKSVFVPDEEHVAAAHVLSGPPVDEPEFEKGLAYFVAPDKKGERMPVPKFSIRSELGSDLTDAEIDAFPRNIANRLWSLMMGRGLVDPVDLHHSDNPPSHPELLEVLSERLVAMNYDVRAFLRELALSETYQRSSLLPRDAAPEAYPEDRFAVAILKPLTPEQFAWSLLQATGQVENQRRAQRARQQSDPRLQELLGLDAKRQFIGEEKIERASFNALGGSIPAFVREFGAAEGESTGPFEATAYQALFLTNGNTIHAWCQSFANRVNGQFAGENWDPSAVVDELYVNLLSRLPSAAERDELTTTLGEAAEDDRQTMLYELTWAMLSSAEFRFNH